MIFEPLFTRILSGEHAGADSSLKCMTGVVRPEFSRWMPRVSELDGLCPPIVERELPRGDVAVIVNLGGERDWLEPSRLERRHSLGSAWVSGLHDHSIITASGRRAWFCFAQLTAEGAYRALGVSPRELMNRIVPLEDMLGVTARDLISQMHDASSAHRRIQLLGRFLIERAAALTRWDATMNYALSRIDTTQGTLGVTALSREIGWSRKHLHRRMVHITGFGPSRWSQIVRFHAALKALNQRPAPSLARVAHALEYSDQSHFSREFREIAGMTATEYLSTRAFSLDYAYARLDVSH